MGTINCQYNNTIHAALYLVPNRTKKTINCISSIRCGTLIICCSALFQTSDVLIVGITILLSLTVFQLIVAEKVPSTSLATPLISEFQLLFRVAEKVSHYQESSYRTWTHIATFVSGVVNDVTK